MLFTSLENTCLPAVEFQQLLMLKSNGQTMTSLTFIKSCCSLYCCIFIFVWLRAILQQFQWALSWWWWSHESSQSWGMFHFIKQHIKKMLMKERIVVNRYHKRSHDYYSIAYILKLCWDLGYCCFYISTSKEWLCKRY